MPVSLVERIGIILLVSAASLASVHWPTVAAAQDDGIRLIRDTEVENIIREYAAPVFQTTGLDPAAIKVHIVHDNRLNAFVAGGLHLFLNTGLLTRSDNAGQVIGVIAHETGHIVGGHLVRLRQQLRDTQVQSILSFLLGAAAGILAQDSRAGMAVIALGTKATEGTLLRYSRTQETSADQFAVTALDSAGISSEGLMEFMQILMNQEFLVIDRQDPYQRTHPVTGERVAFLRNHIAGSPASKNKLPARFIEMHARMRAKLIGFLDFPLGVLGRYDEGDPAIEARYARAIAFYRDAQIDRAVAAIDALIAGAPNDPYFHELKGQVLFENGRIGGSIESYRRAVALMPDAPLILTALGQALLETRSASDDTEALGHLKESVRRDPDNPMSWHMLGIAYGRGGDTGMASLALAEESLLVGDLPRLRLHVQRADKLLAKGTPAWQRLQDIRRVMEQAASENQRQ